MSPSRVHLLRVYDHLYEPWGRIGEACTYCGMPSDTMDHVPALSTVSMIRATEIETGRMIKVPACRECNSLLGTTTAHSIVERRAIVREKLTARYRKYLNMPKWDEDDFEDVSPEMAKFIRASSVIAEQVKARTRWMR